MKRFLKKLFLFILPLLLGGLAMELVLRNMPNDYRNKRKYLDAHAESVETLILGSSHAQYGLNPAYFSSRAFNAAHVSQTLDLDLDIIEKYADRWSSLKTVVLPISYFTLFERLSEGPESWRIKNYTLYYGIHSSRSPIDYTEILSNRLSVNCERIVSYYGAHQPVVVCDSLGWDTLHTAVSPGDLVAAGKVSAQRHTVQDMHSKKNRELLADNLQALDRMAQWCADRNVRLILFTPPAYASYREQLVPEQLRITVQTAARLASERPYISYHDFMFDSAFSESDFYDGDHLLASGAAKLSRMIDALCRAVP